jgi:hypothetical protein
MPSFSPKLERTLARSCVRSVSWLCFACLSSLGAGRRTIFVADIACVKQISLSLSSSCGMAVALRICGSDGERKLVLQLVRLLLLLLYACVLEGLVEAGF